MQTGEFRQAQLQIGKGCWGVPLTNSRWQLKYNELTHRKLERPAHPEQRLEQPATCQTVLPLFIQQREVITQQSTKHSLFVMMGRSLQRLIITMDIDQIRFANYKALLTKFWQRPDQRTLPKHGQLKRFADHAEVSVRYLSHINAGRKNIGPAVARQMEAGCGVPHGWLDTLHEGAPGDDAEKAFLSTMLTLYRESPEQTHQMVLEHLVKRVKRQNDRPGNRHP